jgi:hypothetical protein
LIIGGLEDVARDFLGFARRWNGLVKQMQKNKNERLEDRRSRSVFRLPAKMNSIRRVQGKLQDKNVRRKKRASGRIFKTRILVGGRERERR